MVRRGKYGGRPHAGAKRCQNVIGKWRTRIFKCKRRGQQRPADAADLRRAVDSAWGVGVERDELWGDFVEQGVHVVFAALLGGLRDEGQIKERGQIGELGV